MREAEHLVDEQTDAADEDDPCKDLVRLQEALRLENRVAQPRIRRHQFGDDEVSPRPAHGDTQGIEQGGLG